MVLGGEIDSTYAYSFIVSDVPKEEQPHRRGRALPPVPGTDRGALQGRQAWLPLRHLPSGKLAANRLWLCCSLLALNLAAFICDISPAAATSGQAADEDTTLAPPCQGAQADPVLRAWADRPLGPADRRTPARGTSPISICSTPPTTPRSRSPVPRGPAGPARPASATPPTVATPQHGVPGQMLQSALAERAPVPAKVFLLRLRG
jgi:hypothetical protein